MIELREVSIRAGEFALRDISFLVNQGAYAVLMGKTGSGKTTILESVCGLRTVTSGQIVLDGNDVTRLRPAKRHTGYVPQDLALFTTMTVRQHLEFAPRRRGFSKDRLRAKVDELCGLLGIEALLERRIHGLSGGEGQRVALGRALSFEPPVLLLDEPLSALDEWTRDEIYELLREVQKSTGVTALHITHSRSEAKALGTQWLLLQDGKIRECGTDEL